MANSARETARQINGFVISTRAYLGKDKSQGFPALETIRKMKPTFFVGTGDNIYYDSHDEREATTLSADAKKNGTNSFDNHVLSKLFQHVPTYWEKDDHDHRFDDSDREGDQPPSSDLGIATFREQVPVVDPTNPDAKTYRTYRVNQHLQIWLVEGRDYRSPNKMEDGPDKVLWGPRATCLAEADPAFQRRNVQAINLSPPPMVGPDDARKRDNHTNIKGFQHEGLEFFKWVVSHGLHQKGFYTVCGDRHWQYHARHSLGIEEFSCGALVDANSRLGRKPGDPKSTDPNATIKQLYTQKSSSGGFLRVAITRDGKGRFEFYDEHGNSLYHNVKDPGTQPLHTP